MSSLKNIFNKSRDVAFDSTGNVYVTDFSNHRIQVFTSEAQFLRQFAIGKGSGKRKHPTGISIDSENIVYVSEFGNNRISVFTCEGKFLTSFGMEGRVSKSCTDCYELTVHSE